MAHRVAVANAPSLVLLGLTSAIADSGYEVESTDDPKSWAEAHSGQAILIGIRIDSDIDVLRDLMTRAPSVTSVALMDPLSDDRICSALEAGATGCVSMDWSGDRVLMALEAGMEGLSLLPRSVARDLAIGATRRARPQHLTSVQQNWLRRLATGMTTQQLAVHVGFSERETYRRLRQIYSTMGVGGRTEALIVASASGLLDAPAGD